MYFTAMSNDRLSPQGMIVAEHYSARSLVVKLDAVGLHGDLSAGVALSADHQREVSEQRWGSLTPRFFLFFSFLNPAPRVTIRSLEAFAP